MKRFLATLCVIASASLSVAAAPSESASLPKNAWRQELVVLDLTEGLADYTLSALDVDLVVLSLDEAQARELRLSWEDQGQCLYVDFSPPFNVGGRQWILVAPEFNWDDGANTCVIKLKTTAGTQNTITISHDILD